MAETTKVLKPDDDKSDDTNPLIPDKLENDLKKSKFGRWILWVLSLVLVPCAGWAGNKCLDVYNSFEDLRQHVRDLENDKANNAALWSAIAENRTKSMDLKIHMDVVEKLFDREFSKSVMDRYIEFQLQREMLNAPKATLPPPSPEKHADRIPIPEVKPIDPDLFRKEKEQQYPNRPVQKK